MQTKEFNTIGSVFFSKLPDIGAGTDASVQDFTLNGGGNVNTFISGLSVTGNVTVNLPSQIGGAYLCSLSYLVTASVNGAIVAGTIKNTSGANPIINAPFYENNFTTGAVAAAAPQQVNLQGLLIVNDNTAGVQFTYQRTDQNSALSNIKFSIQKVA